MNVSVELRGVLDRVGHRFRLVRLLGGLTVCWAALALVGLAAGASAESGRLLAVGVAVSALAAGLVCWSVTRQMARDPRWLARRIEAYLASESLPELSGVKLVRTAADFDTAMPEFVRAFLADALAEVP